MNPPFTSFFKGYTLCVENGSTAFLAATGLIFSLATVGGVATFLAESGDYAYLSLAATVFLSMLRSKTVIAFS